MTPIYKTLGRQFARQVSAQPMIRHALRRLSQTGLVPPEIWKRLPVDDTFTIVLKGGESFEYMSISDDSIGRALFWRGIRTWETETINIYYELAKRSQLVIDVGANTGIYTLIACATNEQSRVYAFEPVPHVYERLIKNIHLNEWQNRCSVQDIAISNKNDSVQFHIPYGDVPTSASLKPDGFRGVDGFLVDMTTRTLDSICGNEHADLVKIDVEGFEDEVLLGMTHILQRSAPAIIVECNPDGPFQKVEKILSDLRYVFFHINASGLVRMMHIEPDVTERFRNYLCLPPQRMDSIP